MTHAGNTFTGVNWASRPAMQMATDIYDGAGPAATHEAAEAWRELSAGLTAASTEFVSATKLARGSWEGPGADAAQAALAPFTDWAATAENIANALSSEASFTAEAFSTTKATMPSPAEVAAVAAVKDNTADKVVGLLTAVPTPGEIAEGVAAQQQAEASTAMTGYDFSTSLAGTYQSIELAPTLTTEVISPTEGSGSSLSHADLDAGTARHYATMSAGIGYDPSGGAAHGGGSGAGDGGATHPAGSGAAAVGSTSSSPGVNTGSAPNSGASGGSQSTAAAAGLGAGGAMGVGSARTFSASNAFGRSAGGLAGAGSAPGGGATGSTRSAGGMDAGDPTRAGCVGAGRAGRAGSAGNREQERKGSTRTTGLSNSATIEGGVSGSAPTTSESSVHGTRAGSTSAVGASGDDSHGHAAPVGPVAGTGNGRSPAVGPGAGMRNGQDDDEHEIPDYLKDLEHFTDGRVVAPAVIGVDDEP